MEEMRTKILTIIFIVLIVSSVPAASAKLVNVTDLRENDKLGRAGDKALVVEYVKQELRKLRSEVEQLDADQGVKKSLLVKIDAASEKNDKALQFVLEGKEKQADNMLKSVSNILNAFINEIDAQSGKKIATDDAENLIQHTNEIIKGIEEWDSTDELLSKLENAINKLNNVTSTTDYAEVENFVTEVENIIQELQARGYNVYLNEEIPAIIVETPGVGIRNIYLFELGAAIGAFEAVYEIHYIQNVENKTVCFECQKKIFASRISSAFAGDLIVHWAVVKWGLKLGPVDIRDKIDPCDDPWCFFGAADLVAIIDDVLSHAHVNQTYTINTTISNLGRSRAEQFNVAFYDNNTLIGNQSVGGLDPKDSIKLQFNWKPTWTGTHELMVFADSEFKYPWGEVYEPDEYNNIDKIQVIVYPPGYVECTLYNTKWVPSSSDPTQPLYMVWYYKTEHPVLLSPSMRTPTFIYHTTQPVYSPTGFQVFYPYGAIWQFYGDSEDGPWHPCWFNPYAVCQPNITEYSVKHWAMGSGYYQYFAVKMTTGAGPWPSPILKTFLTNFEIRENV